MFLKNSVGHLLTITAASLFFSSNSWGACPAGTTPYQDPVSYSQQAYFPGGGTAVETACFNAVDKAVKQMNSDAKNACDATLPNPPGGTSIITSYGDLDPGLGHGTPTTVACSCYPIGGGWYCAVRILNAAYQCCANN